MTTDLVNTLQSAWQLTLRPLPFICWAAILGACLGSFYGVCIDRYLRGTPMSLRSHCAHCQRTLRVRHLIPVLSWVCLGGRCGYCRGSIGWEKPVLEVFSALLAAMLAWRWGPTAAFMALLVVSGALTVASGIDLACTLLPDVITLPLAMVTPVVSITMLGLTWQESLLGALLGAGTLLALRQYFWWRRGVEALGLGDVKLMLSLGALCGLSALPLLLLASSLSGLAASAFWLLRRPQGQSLHETAIPFGPFLCCGCLLVMLWR